MREERTPHERRQYSLRMAGILTAILFVGWLATLGLRLSQSASVAQDIQSTAATIIAVQQASTTLSQ